jgi:hypothetical protein
MDKRPFESPSNLIHVSVLHETSIHERPWSAMSPETTIQKAQESTGGDFGALPSLCLFILRASSRAQHRDPRPMSQASPMSPTSSSRTQRYSLGQMESDKGTVNQPTRSHVLGPGEAQ